MLHAKYQQNWLNGPGEDLVGWLVLGLTAL